MSAPTLLRQTLALGCIMALAGCTSLAPHHEVPAMPVPEVIGNGATPGQVPVIGAAFAWDDVLLDPRLRKVVALALQENRDLRVAVLNIEEARAQYRIRRADLLPGVALAASESRSRGNGPAGATGRSEIVRAASAEVGFSAWELDLFGRIRSLGDQALATFLSTEQVQRDVRLTLVAEVAATWLRVSADQQRLALARQTLESQRETLRLTSHLHAQGIASGLELAQVQTIVERARVDVAAFTTQLAQSRNALALVVGAPIDPVLLPDDAALAAGVALALIPADVDSRVLLQRPDIRAAEFTLQAANASIGAARAAFFPSISLTGWTGRRSDQLSNLFDGGSRTWSFVPSLNLPIFNAGALRAELDVAKVRQDISVAQYERTVQEAFAEAADALAAREQLVEQLAAQQGLVDASQRSYTLAEARYRAGVDSYLDALDAQRTLYAARQELIGLKLAEANNRVTLIAVLGGGSAEASDS